MTGGTSVLASANTATTITIAVDRQLPNYTMFPALGTGCSHMFLIYPPGGYVKLLWGGYTPIPYWSPVLYHFDNNCDVSVKDVDVWNMNINWTQLYQMGQTSSA